MTRRDDTVSIRHMFDYAVEAVEMARGRSRADLDRDRYGRIVPEIGERHRQQGVETVSGQDNGAHREEYPTNASLQAIVNMVPIAFPQFIGRFQESHTVGHLQ